jgi:membrane protein
MAADERASESADDRGRDAERPSEIPPSGWYDILSRVRRRIVDDRLPIVAAGVAFYAVLAAFPALSALLAIAGLAFDPQRIPERLSGWNATLSPEALRLAIGVLQGLADARTHRLGLSLGGSVLFAVWGASLGIRMLMSALNVSYGEKETRRYIVRIGLALLLTVGALCVATVMIAVVVAAPALIRLLGLEGVPRHVFDLVRWPVVALIFWASLLVMYRYGPSRAQPRWSWVGWGAFAATALWLCGSALLSWYVDGFGRYNTPYGAVGLVVILLVWFLLSAYAVLIGAEINAEQERQTRVDTTVGADRPIGARGARAADGVAEGPGRTV